MTDNITALMPAVPGACFVFFVGFVGGSVRAARKIINCAAFYRGLGRRYTMRAPRQRNNTNKKNNIYDLVVVGYHLFGIYCIFMFI